MKKNLAPLLIAIFTFLILGGIVFLAIKTPSTSSSTATAPKVGDNEINFSLPSIDNTTYSLASYKGKSPVFVEFFAVWCPHCQRETTIINALEAQYGSKIQFLDVQASQYGKNAESGDTTLATQSDFTWFRDTFHVTVPILKDPNTKTANAYGVQGFPTFFIINKDGKVTYTDSGEITQDTLASKIQKVI